MDNNTPLVSIIMTAYNREAFISEAIESVLASTYQNFELIIVDDSSIDNTVLLAKRFAEKDKRIKIYCNEVNLGDYPNRNIAASYATGKYLKYLDSDDIIYPWGLAAMVYCMEKFPDAGYGLISYGIKTINKFPILLSPVQAYCSFFFHGSMIITGPTGAIIKRELFDNVKGFSGKPYIGDTEMWLKLSSNHQLVAMPLDLIWWRQHENQQYKIGTNNNYYEYNSYNIYLEALLSNLCPFNKIYRINAIRNLKNRYCRNIFKLAIKGKILRSYKLCRSCKLTPFDFIKSLKYNKYPADLNNW